MDLNKFDLIRFSFALATLKKSPTTFGIMTDFLSRALAFFSAIVPVSQSFLLSLANRASEENYIAFGACAKTFEVARMCMCVYAKRERFAGESISHGGTGVVVVSNNSHLSLPASLLPH